ncbi:RTA1 like protein-domain-containing protein [Cadophora sp. MPI-SDFR-AT-0126]|nr:RTA1 like protein-domain-containing protein [Leotiomycetes sp. MPI-SDFR-AT-0126]
MSANVIGLEGIASNITSLDQCNVELCTLDYASLRYVPNLGANAAFFGVFVSLLIAQIGLWFSSRTRSYTFSMICGLILEAVGYAFRIVMRKRMFADGPFLVQIICITIAPVFFTAALYLTLSRVIVHYGIYNSRISSKAYTIGFIAADFLALVLQSTGGALAETANDRATSKAGTNVMVGGLAFQVASLAVFIGLAAEFFWRVKADRKHIRATNWAYGVPEKPAGDIDGLETFLYAFTLATFLILIRSCFRVAELVNGFRSKLANNEVAFMILEGGMIVFAALILTFFHPGLYFGREMWKGDGWGRELRYGRSSPELWKVESAGTSIHGSYGNVSRPWPLQQ